MRYHGKTFHHRVHEGTKANEGRVTKYTLIFWKFIPDEEFVVPVSLCAP